jgi:hypothetical protein
MGFERSGYINTPHTSSGTSSTYTGLGAGTILYSAGTSWPETAQEIRDTPGVDAQKTGDN